QAEYWLRGWKAPVVHFVTLGYINPRQMVIKEVRVALEDVSRLLNTTLWWVTVQTTLRIACGLALWGSYALHPPALAGSAVRWVEWGNVSPPRAPTEGQARWRSSPAAQCRTTSRRSTPWAGSRARSCRRAWPSACRSAPLP